MSCYEHELMCLMMEREALAVDPQAAIDRMEISEALTARGIGSLAALCALGRTELDDLAQDLLGRVALAA